MTEAVRLQPSFYVMAFVSSDDHPTTISQVGIAPVIDVKIDNADLYFENGDGAECPSFIEEWNSLEFILKEEQVVISSKKDLQLFRSTLSKHRISMPIIPNLVDANQILSADDIEQTAEMATDARAMATLLAYKLMPRKGQEKTTVDATLQNPFFGKIFVITGKVYEHERDDIAHFLELLGAHRRQDISSVTNFVLTGDNPGYSKLRRAREYYEQGKDITRISYSQILEIMNLCKPYVEKKIFHKEVDEQDFLDQINRIVNQARESADFSDVATNYAALATERKSTRHYESSPRAEMKRPFPLQTRPLGDVKELQRCYNRQTSKPKREYPTWAKGIACLIAASVALGAIYETGLLIPLGLIGLATSGLIKK